MHIIHREYSDESLVCTNQFELEVFTLYISTNKLLFQSVMYTYQKVVK